MSKKEKAKQALKEFMRQKILNKFAQPYIIPIWQILKTELYAKSPLRTNFQIRPLDDGELSVYENEKKAYYYDVDNDIKPVNIIEIAGGQYERKFVALHPHCLSKAKLVHVPLFEIGCNPLMPYKKAIKLSQEDVLRSFIKENTILEQEQNFYTKFKKCLPKSIKGQGVFAIRVDLTVLPAVDPKEDLIGFSIFEQIGILFLAH
jgi:hypothetical protein